MNILIIGAGPTGLSAALELGAHGLSCRIVERRKAPSELSRAIGIMPATLNALTRLGAGAAISAEGMAIHRITLKRGSRPLMRLDVTKGKIGSDFMTALPQNRTEEILTDALRDKGIQPEYGVTVEQVSTDGKTAVAAFGDGTEAAFDWIIAADGIHSAARQSLGIAYPGFDLPDEWSIADVDVAEEALMGPFDPNGAVGYIQDADGGFGMVLPMEPRRARVVSSTRDALAALSEPLPVENIRRTATFSIAIRQAETYQKGRVLLAGDAAHCHSPVGGKGMNLGISDGIAAARAIALGETDGYSNARHEIGARVMTASERGRKFITANTPITRLTATTAGFLAERVPAVGAAFMRGLTQL